MEAGREAGQTAASAIAPVLERLEAIGESLPPGDGVAYFNELYVDVTRAVAKEAESAGFADPAFISSLDVVFADLYFRAVDPGVPADEVPHAWAPLIEARSRPKVAPIQFAIAGMNAHINHDLALALVEATDAAGIELDRNSEQHRDYLLVNSILERVEAQVKERYATGLVGVADEALGRLDDMLAIWSIARARDAAWNHAETIVALRRLPRLHDEFLLTLGRTVGLAGRGLLIPTL
jgi:hypothetical protein